MHCEKILCKQNTQRSQSNAGKERVAFRHVTVVMIKCSDMTKTLIKVKDVGNSFFPL